MSALLRIVQLGLGPIGRESARLVARRAGLRLVGAVDNDPALEGRDVAELTGSPEAAGLKVESDLEEALSRLKPDVVLQTTGSRLSSVMDQIESVIAAKANLASTSEELFYPYRRHPKEAKRINAMALQHGVSVLGTGVNPGFAMDTLALCLSGVCREVRSVTIRRVVDAATRRGPLQKKVGAGLEPDEFRRRVARRELGHVGLVESLDLLAAALGLPVENVEETIEPVISEVALQTEYVSVAAGQVAGIHHTAVGRGAGGNLVSLDLKMYVGAPAPFDEVVLVGDPPVSNRVEGGIAGDAATAGILVNAAWAVCEAEPGLRTAIDMPLIRWRG